jgi:ADP-ribose pyrophosphatase YjhB (NUDIX family)
MAAAVMGILETPQGILFTRRARDPGKSMLDLPGGFVDYGETLEGAVRREIREELGLELPVIRYFGSFPNTYAYRGVTYHTADAVFVCPVDPRNRMRLSDEIVETVVLRPADVNPDVLAFDSAKLALREYLARGSHF